MFITVTTQHLWCHNRVPITSDVMKPNSSQTDCSQSQVILLRSIRHIITICNFVSTICLSIFFLCEYALIIKAHGLWRYWVCFLLSSIHTKNISFSVSVSLSVDVQDSHPGSRDVQEPQLSGTFRIEMCCIEPTYFPILNVRQACLFYVIYFYLDVHWRQPRVILNTGWPRTVSWSPWACYRLYGS